MYPFQSVRSVIAFALLVVATLAPVACAPLPDPGPFSLVTTELSEAVRTSGRASADELRRMTNGDTLAPKLETAWKARTASMDAMVRYADSLVAIVRSTEQSGAAAQSLAEKIGNLATAAGIVNPAAGASVKVAADVAKFVWAQIALAKGAADLEKALEAAQPAIDIIADTIAADDADLRKAIDAARLNQIAQIKGSPGANEILGLYDHAPELKAKLIGGFSDTTSLSQAQNDKLKELEGLLAAARPDYDRLSARLAEVDKRNAALRTLIAATDDAIARWSVAHKSLLQSVRDRSPVNIDSLTSAVIDLREITKKVREL